MFDRIYSRITKAPEFPSDFNWINTSESLSLEKLKGHVDKRNIEQAVRRYEISHPVIIDRQMTCSASY